MSLSISEFCQRLESGDVSFFGDAPPFIVDAVLRNARQLSADADEGAIHDFHVGASRFITDTAFEAELLLKRIGEVTASR